MEPRNFFAELKRLNVYRVGVAYAVVAWLLIQVTDTVFPRLNLPEWAVTLVIVLLLLGLPVALVLAWAFELTTEGIVRTEDVAPGNSTTRRTGRKLTGAVVVLGAVAAALFAFQFLRPKAPSIVEGGRTSIPDQSIAVLPFVDLSQAKDQEYFCDGISEELLDSLSRIEGLRVVARTSAFAFKGKTVPASEIAQKLGVRHLLEGSLRRDGNRIRITAQLSNARDGYQLWSQTFERELQGVFAVQDEITRAIIDALKVKLALAPPSVPPVNPEAHELYLRGLYFSKRSGEAD